MIATVFRIGLLRLVNNKQEMLLTFVVPILFFTIFALIFSRGIAGGPGEAIKIAVIDDDDSQLTHAILEQLAGESAVELRVLQDHIAAPVNSSTASNIAELSREMIRAQQAAVVVHLPAGTEQGLRQHTPIQIGLLTEGTNPVAPRIVRALIAQALAEALPERPRMTALRGPPPQGVVLQPPHLQASEAATHPAGNMQRLPPVDDPYGTGRESHQAAAWEETFTPVSLANGVAPVSFEELDVFSATKNDPKTAMYAAGIAVMFLLFSASGAGGSLLEEHEAGTLDRLLTSRLTVPHLLAGKWLFITALGCTQLTVMFVWAQLVFGVNLMKHLEGFAVMTISTAAATASLALCLAVFCRSRAQLNAVSVVLILTMSALGGSMVPRYIMSADMQRLGQFTFNAWAYDGYKKIFWHDLPVSAITMEVCVLWAIALYLAFVAAAFADRWKAR